VRLYEAAGMTTSICVRETDLQTVVWIVYALDRDGDGGGLRWSTLDGLKVPILCGQFAFDPQWLSAPVKQARPPLPEYIRDPPTRPALQFRALPGEAGRTYRLLLVDAHQVIADPWYVHVPSAPETASERSVAPLG
jgi:hypothetical protein